MPELHFLFSPAEAGVHDFSLCPVVNILSGKIVALNNTDYKQFPVLSTVKFDLLRGQT